MMYFYSRRIAGWNPLRREWVLVSPHRTSRPWQGQTETPAAPAVLTYDSTCYLCPGNMRAGGERTPEYTSTFVFANDYAALQTDLPKDEYNVHNMGLLYAETERGVCRVVCFDPRHDLTLATMSVAGIRRVVDMWVEQATELTLLHWVKYVQIFENRGAMMGASNPHPHGQIWATENIPNETGTELAGQQAYYAEHREPLLAAYLRLELEAQERVVAANDAWVALVPFWAVWPFEILLLPLTQVETFDSLSDSQREGLAAILKSVTTMYNRVFDTPFPYSMGFHPAPADNDSHPEWTLHAHFYPPLLRSATIKKFMVGFELLGSPQRDITPESAAATLRQALQAAEATSSQ